MKRILTVLAVAVFSLSLSSAAFAGGNVWKKCASCHGKDGKAQTKMGKKLGVRDLTKADVQASFTDEDIAKAIKNGVEKKGKKVMKGSSKYSDAQIAELVKMVRSFKGK